MVLVLSNVSAQVECEHLFNLFCLYCNVLKVRLAPRNNEAFLLIETLEQAEQATEYLNGATLFESAIAIRVSPLLTLVETTVGQASSRVSREYYQSPLHRFNRPNSNATKYVCRPSKMIYFSNAAATQSEASLVQLFVDLGAERPAQCVFFLPSTKKIKEPKKIGLIEMSSAAAATTAIALANHMIDADHILKLAFSTNRIQKPGSGDSAATAAAGGKGGSASAPPPSQQQHARGRSGAAANGKSHKAGSHADSESSWKKADGRKRAQHTSKQRQK